MSLPFDLDNVSSILYVDDSLEEFNSLSRRLHNPISSAPIGSKRNPIDLTGEGEEEEERNDIIDLTRSRYETPANSPRLPVVRIQPQPVVAPQPQNIGVPPRIQSMIQLGVEQGVLSEQERSDIDYWLNTPSPTRPFVPSNVIYRQNQGMRAFDKLVSHFCA